MPVNTAVCAVVRSPGKAALLGVPSLCYLTPGVSSVSCGGSLKHSDEAYHSRYSHRSIASPTLLLGRDIYQQ